MLDKTIALILVVAAAGSAYALDMTGTYEGKQVCRGLLKENGEKDKFSVTPAMSITQDGDKVRVHVTPSVDYEGTVVDDAKDPVGKGQATIVSCSPSQDASGYAEVLHVKKATLGKDGVKLTVKGVSAFSTSLRVGNCTWTFKRVSTADPGVGVCP